MLSSVPQEPACHPGERGHHARLRASRGKSSATHEDLAAKFQDLERRVDERTADIKLVSQIIRQLLEPAPETPKRPIGFRVSGD